MSRRAPGPGRASRPRRPRPLRVRHPRRHSRGADSRHDARHAGARPGRAEHPGRTHGGRRSPQCRSAPLVSSLAGTAMDRGVWRASGRRPHGSGQLRAGALPAGQSAGRHPRRRRGAAGGRRGDGYTRRALSRGAPHRGPTDGAHGGISPGPGDAAVARLAAGRPGGCRGGGARRRGRRSRYSRNVRYKSAATASPAR